MTDDAFDGNSRRERPDPLVPGSSAGSMPREMSLHREVRGLQVVEVYGEIDLHTVSMLDEALDEAIEALSRKRETAGDGSGAYVVLNLCPVDFLDSQGIRALFGYQEALKSLGGELLVAAEPGEVMEILKMTGVDGIFRIFNSLDEALRAAGV